MSDTADTVLITGASGFLGHATVRAALADDCRVIALVRSAESRGKLPDHERLSVVELDLGDDSETTGHNLRDAVHGVDAVLHLAARMSGDDAQHARDTVAPTRRLLEAAGAAGVKRFVLVSSLAVYGYHALRPGQTLDEHTPLETRPERRDAYCRAKLAQERVLREHAGAVPETVIARPGAIVGPGRWWTARLGRQVAGGWTRFGSRAEVPVIHVDEAARALVHAAFTPGAAGKVFNLIGSNPPTQRQYAGWLKPVLRPTWSVTVSPTLLRGVAAFASALHRGLLRGKGRLPGVLVPETLAALIRPVRFDNTAMRQTLGDPGPIDWNSALRDSPADR